MSPNLRRSIVIEGVNDYQNERNIENKENEI